MISVYSTKQRNDLGTIIAESQLLPETKKAIDALLQDKTLHEAVIEQKILLLVSAEIDQDMTAAGVSLDENDPDLMQAQQEYDESMQLLEKEVEEDAQLIEQAYQHLRQQTEAVI